MPPLPSTLTQAVVLSESLCLRLPGCPGVCADMVHGAVSGSVEAESTSDAAAAETTVADIFDHGSLARGALRGRGCTVPPAASLAAGHRLFRPSSDVRRPESRLALASLLCTSSCRVRGEPPPSLEEHDAARALGRPLEALDRYVDLMRRLYESHWPSAGLREWVYHVGRGDRRSDIARSADDGRTSEQGWRAKGEGHDAAIRGADVIGSRMYLQHGEGELRVALALAASD